MAPAPRPDRPAATRLSAYRKPARPRPSLPRALRVAYERAVYRVDAPTGAFRLRVGSKSAALDRLLAAHDVASASLLSAANPGSQPLSAAANRRRHRQLRARLAEAGFRSVPGESFEERTGGWREASFLVLGIERRPAIALARDFGQSALLFARRGAPVRLLVAAAGM